MNYYDKEMQQERLDTCSLTVSGHHSWGYKNYIFNQWWDSKGKHEQDTYSRYCVACGIVNDTQLIENRI